MTISIIAFVFGMMVGSFLNVVIDRVPRGEGVMRGRSRCDACKKTLAWHDLIPVLSFLLLRRKCRYCKVKLSFQYPLLEFTTGVLFFAGIQRLLHADPILPLSFSTIVIGAAFLYFLAVLLALVITDLKYMIIPDVVLLPAIFIVAITVSLSHVFDLSFVFSSLFFGLRDFSTVYSFPVSLRDALYGVVLLEAIFIPLYIFSRGRGLGFGDVKLVILIGLLAGFRGSFTVYFLSFVTAMIVAILLIVFQRAGLKTKLPLGSFLAATTLFVLLTGFDILHLLNFY